LFDLKLYEMTKCPPNYSQQKEKALEKGFAGEISTWCWVQIPSPGNQQSI
jgi:hypothetical protein